MENNQTGERRTLPARALFVFIGAAPATGWLGDELYLDEDGFVRTGFQAARPQTADETAAPQFHPLPLEASRPGVFAVGDVRSGSVKRVASAVGEGAMAVRMVYERAWMGR